MDISGLCAWFKNLKNKQKKKSLTLGLVFCLNDVICHK